jgi:hypothetical protein
VKFDTVWPAKIDLQVEIHVCLLTTIVGSVIASIMTGRSLNNRLSIALTIGSGSNTDGNIRASRNSAGCGEGIAIGAVGRGGYPGRWLVQPRRWPSRRIEPSPMPPEKSRIFYASPLLHS